jgi:hypothetical protein
MQQMTEIPDTDNRKIALVHNESSPRRYADISGSLIQPTSSDARHGSAAIRFAGRASYGLLGSVSIAVIGRARSTQAGQLAFTTARRR